MKKLAMMIILSLVFSLFPGCLDPVSLDEYGYVVTVGADRGEEKKYFITFALQRGLSEPGTEAEGGAQLLTCEGDSLDEAVKETESRMSCTLNFSRTNFFVFSRELAEAGDIEELLSISFDSMKIRPFAAVVVSDCEAYRFIGGMSANNDANVNKLQSGLFLDARRAGLSQVMSVSLLIEAAQGGAFDYSAALGDEDGEIITDTAQKTSQNEGEDPLKDIRPGDKAGGLKAYVKGAALFSGWRMTGELTREESVYLDMVCGSFTEGTVTLPLGEEAVTLMVKLTKVKREVFFENGKPKASVIIRLEAGVHEAPRELSESEFDEWLRDTAPGLLEAACEEVFIKCREAKSDAMRFGKDAVKRFSSYEEWLEFDWKRAYEGMEAAFTFELVNTDKTAGGGML